MENIIHLKRSVINSLLSYALGAHPKEGILLLKGKISRNKIVISEVVIPPLATHGKGFSAFPTHMLPIDFSIVGVAHSHPSGALTPSIGDLNRFYGRIMVIIAFPYQSERDVAVFNREGKTLKFEIIE